MDLVDPSYELVDPCPDICALFMDYNNTFFEGKLAACVVSWSPRMTSCAGVCSYRPREGLCSIRLSEPLLKLRPRKDLIETLLHEMIHAYLFVTERNQDRDGHGPEFQYHMVRINSIAHTNITIYHTFHAEVAVYKTHHWRCDGPCHTRRPFFGWVKRASNRAPGPNDTWWTNHQNTCGGTYHKVKEPEGYKAKKKPADNKRNKGHNTLDSWVSPSKKPPTTRPKTNKPSGRKVVGGPPRPTNTLDGWVSPSNKEHTSKPLFAGSGQKLGGGNGVSRLLGDAGPSSSSLPSGSGQRLGGGGNGISRLLDSIERKGDHGVAKTKQKAVQKSFGDNNISTSENPLVVDDDDDGWEAILQAARTPPRNENLPYYERLGLDPMRIVHCDRCGAREFAKYFDDHLIECGAV